MNEEGRAGREKIEGLETGRGEHEVSEGVTEGREGEK